MTKLLVITLFLCFFTVHLSAQGSACEKAASKPDHCTAAADHAEKAGNELGHDNYGTAAREAVKAAGAAFECARDKYSKSRKKNTALTPPGYITKRG